MKIATGTVVDGRVEIPAQFVPEGAQVMILAPEESEPVQLSRSQEDELTQAMEQIDRGEYCDGLALLDDLRARNLG